MRPLAIVFLGTLLVSALGCGKTEDPAKFPENTAGIEAKTPEIQTASKTQTPKTPTIGVAETNPKEMEKLATSPMNSTPSVQTSPPETKPPLPKEFAAFSYIPDEAVALLSIRPKSVMEHPAFKALHEAAIPVKRASSAPLQAFEITLPGLDRYTQAFWFSEESFKSDVPPNEDHALGFSNPSQLRMLLIYQFDTPVDPKLFEGDPNLAYQTVTHKNVSYRQADSFAVHLPDPVTMIVTHPKDMPKLLDVKTPAKLVRTALDKGLDHDVTLVSVKQPLPPKLKAQVILADILVPGAADLPDQIECLFSHLDINEGVDFQIVVETNHEAAPITIQNAFKKSHAWIEEKMAEFPATLKRDFGEELGTEVLNLYQEIYSSIAVKAEGKQFKATMRAPKRIETVISKILSLQKAKEQERSRLKHLKQFAIALHNYHEFYRMYPFPNGRSDAPQPERDKLSWRVHLLPFIEQEELYKKFKRDEAWDSEHNKALLEQMPAFYKLSEDAKPGHTQFVAPAGAGFVVDGERVPRVSDFIDGTSNTIVVVSVKPEEAQPWTKPGGFDLDPETASEILGGDPNGFLALFCDGSTRILDPKMERDTLKALLTLKGKENTERTYLDGLKR